MDLDFSQSTVDLWTVIHVSGEVDVHSATDLRDRLLTSIDSGTSMLAVDLSEVGFIDSTGLGALVAARNRAAERGVRLHIVCPNERLLKLFRITGLHEVFAMYPSVALAVAQNSPDLPSATA